MIILLDNIDKLKTYVEKVPDIISDLLESFTDPLTVIYPNARNLAKTLSHQTALLPSE